jgi:hypothetical protein
MATVKIPLNKFQRVSTTLTTSPTIIYSAKSQRASIILVSLGTNISEFAQTITLSLSTDTPGSYIEIIKNAPIGSYDSANFTIGKVVLVEGDYLIGECSSNDAVNLTLSILETVNTD